MQKAQTLSKNVREGEVLVPGSRVTPQGGTGSGPNKEAEFESTGGVSWGKARKEETRCFPGASRAPSKAQKTPGGRERAKLIA